MQIVNNAKDGVDRMIETGSAVQTILDNRPTTPATVKAVADLKRIGKELSRVREEIAKHEAPRSTSVRDRPSTRIAS